MIDSLNDLKKLVQLCRKQGITDIEVGTLKIKFGDMPVTRNHADQSVESDEAQDPWANFPGGILSPEQLAFYSAGGVLEEDAEAQQ